MFTLQEVYQFANLTVDGQMTLYGRCGVEERLSVPQHGNEPPLSSAAPIRRGAGLWLEVFEPRGLPVPIAVQNIGAQIRRYAGKFALRDLVEELVISEVGAEILAGWRLCAEIEIPVGRRRWLRG